MKKVLIVMSTLYNGGAERSLVNFLNELPANQYEIDLLLFKREGMFMKQLPSFVNVLETPKELKNLYGSVKKAGLLMPTKVIGTAIASLFTNNSREKRGFRWKYFYRSKISQMEEKYDLAVAYISGEILYFVDEKVKADKKIVWIHNDYVSAMHPKKYDYAHLQNMDQIVSISDSCVDILKEVFPEFAHKVYCLPNITSSVVLNKRADEYYPEEYDKEGINILSIGRLHEQKGFDMAIKAAKIMKASKIDFKWFVIGSGELKEELEKQIVSAQVQDVFKLIGTRDNPYAYIKNCTIFVQPSRYEGKSVVLDETKILARPILVTDYPTVADQIVSDVEGKIVEMSPEGIAKGIIELLSNKEEQEKLISNLQAKDYGNQYEIENYIELFEK